MQSQLRYQTTGRYTRKLDRRCLRPTLRAIVLLRARVPIKQHGIKIRYNVINSAKGAPIYTNVMYTRKTLATCKTHLFSLRAKADFEPQHARDSAESSLSSVLCKASCSVFSPSLSLSLSRSVRYSELLGSFATALFSNAASLRALLVHCLRASVAIASA